MSDQKLKELLNKTTDENVEQTDWTKAWSGKYPILAQYQNEVDIPYYAKEIRTLLNKLKDTYGYNEVDAMLVLKDILAHEMRKGK